MNIRGELTIPLNLYIIDFRVPKKGDTYINKNMDIDICKADNYSNHARERFIVELRPDEFTDKIRYTK